MDAEAGRLVRLTRYRPSQDKVDLGLIAPSGQRLGGVGGHNLLRGAALEAFGGRCVCTAPSR